MAVMSTNAVAFLLLYRFRNGVSMEKLVEAMEKLRQDLFYAGRDVGFTGDMVDVINHAVSTHLYSTVICNFHVVTCATPTSFTSLHCPILFAILCISSHFVCEVGHQQCSQNSDLVRFPKYWVSGLEVYKNTCLCFST